MLKLLTVICASLILAACGSQPAAPEQGGAGVEDRTPAAVKVDSTPVATVSADKTGEYTLAMLKDPKSILSKRSVLFDYDQYVIKDEFKPLVEAHARLLAANTQIKMLIQGNADERGSREYNLALGQKRAEALKKMLILLGAREAQVEAVSLGEEKPRCTEHDEACWAQNRRDDMLYSGEF